MSRFVALSLVVIAGCGSTSSCPPDAIGGRPCSNVGAACADEPDTLGWPMGACAPEGLDCQYGFEDTCECLNGDWLCAGGTDFAVRSHD